MTVDVGKHYRFQITKKLTAKEKREGRVIIKLDPYRVCDIYEVGGGAREHIVKKALRGVKKGHTEQELVTELQSCLNRWQELIDEDKQLL